MSATGPKFSIVERRFWSSASVRDLSRGAPNGREFFLYLLTCDAQTAFPGLFVLKLGEAADDLGWTVDDVRRCLDEVVTKGFVKYDPATRVVFLPTKPRKHAVGLSPNHVTGWRNALRELPSCDLLRAAIEVAEHAIADGCRAEGKSPGAARSLISSLRGDGPAKGSTKPLGKGSRRAPEGLTQAPAEPSACKDHDQEREEDLSALALASVDPDPRTKDQTLDTGKGIAGRAGVALGFGLKLVSGEKA